MQLRERNLSISNSTLNYLLLELSEECSNVTTLINQLQLPELSPKQKAQILAELMTSAIHLQIHCGENFQDLIAQEMENLPDDDELD
ncbi:hypothetical protein [Aphanothece sacrum]|uniref:Uncharacterized protein n=1 Tax=Aphanothece sacrum FPU1 TaxID=1920663 RepID=A0A401IGX3_APHSA|nr:hypothetical protein [Aphanothece sacrum]GBF80533.1 hypothetical protein AsFPU1_1934 [Aphanothece sacrum FPU1]